MMSRLSGATWTSRPGAHLVIHCNVLVRFVAQRHFDTREEVTSNYQPAESRPSQIQHLESAPL